MYDINLKNAKKGKGVYFILIAFGLLFLSVMMLVYISFVNKAKNLDKSVKASDIRVVEDYDSDGDLMYSPVYKYVVDGVEYQCKSSASSGTYPDTSYGIVYYKSSNPKECMTDYSKSNNGLILVFMFIPLIFIIIGLANILKNYKRIRIIKQLNKTGKLIKDIPFIMVDSGFEVNGRRILKPAINYILPDGSMTVLYGDPRFDNNIGDSDGLADLVIDENNLNNYFIDYSINRLSGNLPGDYNTTISSVPEDLTLNQASNVNQKLMEIKNKINK